MPDYNHAYRFEVYSRRWGRRDTYRIKLTATGWNVSHIAINGDCDKEGERFLFLNFRQDYIDYPYKVGRYMEKIWERAHHDNLPIAKIQEMLQAVADWVSLTEENAPVDLIYNE